MKKAILLILILTAGMTSYADTYYFGWDGVGIATRYNYNIGYSYGSYQYKGIANGLAIGAMEIYQQYSVYYDREQMNAVGTSVKYDMMYKFVAPMVVFQLTKSGQTQCYVDVGYGEIQSGTMESHKWSRYSWSQAGAVYDQTNDETSNINGAAFRFGLGLTQFYKLGGNFHLFINEDVGWLLSPLADITKPDFGGIKTNTWNLFQPTYISLRIGIAFITHSRNSDTPYKIYYKQEW